MVYNQEEFIDEAMKGIMMQKTDFKVEVVVGDDFSTDKTLELIRKYENTENIHIKILDRKKGDAYWTKRQAKGRLYNFINIIENCSGKYIALLDGDDYWTDPAKLQKQFDLLCILSKAPFLKHQLGMHVHTGYSLYRCHKFLPYETWLLLFPIL